jgi:tetratricopeptide (TPR) repeat protein
MVSAGRLCLRFYANDDALALHELGLAFVRELGDAERVCLTLELCDIRLAAAPLEEWETAVEEYTALAEQALDHGALEHARLGYQMASYLRWVHGRVSDAQRDSLQAERVTRTADDEAHIMGMAEAAKCLALLERDLPQADAMAMEARALASRRNVQCPPLPTALGILEYYQGRLDEAVDHLEDARTLCKAQGDRVGEYLANEYLAVIEVERGEFSAAMERCRSLLEIGSRLREGSERPFAEAMQALCRYGLSSEDAGLEEILQSLRQADAKQRLTFLLNRGAMLDIRHDRLASAADRAGEALELARLMERPSEMLQAHISLAEILGQRGAPEQGVHLAAVEELAAGQVARWARERADAFLARTS